MKSNHLKLSDISPQSLTVTLWEHIEQSLNMQPDGKFTAIDEFGETDSISYVKARADAMRLASTLNTLDINSGDEIVLCFEDVLDFVVAAWACIFAGYLWVPWSTSDADKNTTDYKASFTALLRKLNNPLVLTTTNLKPLINTVNISLDSSRLLDFNDLTTINPTHNSKGTAVDCSAHGAVLVSSSGTTGAPKLAIVPNKTLLHRRVHMAKSNNFDNLHCFPLHSVTGLSILFPLGQHSIYLNPRRLVSHPQDLLFAIESQQVQSLGLSSYLAAMLINVIDRLSLKTQLGSLKSIGFGADYIAPHIVEGLILRFQALGARNLDIGFAYGMTECGIICSSKVAAKDLLKNLKDTANMPTIGAIAPNVSLRLVNGNAQPVQDGESGNIEIRSEKKLFNGYYNAPKLTSKSFTEDGWFKTGDIGLTRGEQITLVGRIQNKVIINGKNHSLQELEAPLLSTQGLNQSLVFVATLLAKESISSELIVFFVPESFDERFLNILANTLIQAVAEQANIKVQHLIVLKPEDILRTPTGKIRRAKMAENYSQGHWLNFIPKVTHSDNQHFSELQHYLRALWEDILELAQLPTLDESFIYLGGDSLASATLIAELEKKFECDILLTDFYKNPTIRTLENILIDIEKTPRIEHDEEALNTDKNISSLELVHKVGSFVSSWKGERRFKDSLLLGMNTHGKKTPIIWVFLQERQFKRLAMKLGPDQPLYGLRSCSKILAVKDYTDANIQPLVDRYLWEILALPVSHPLFIGGNCQAGIIALALARTLQKINKTPSSLILMEWSFSKGHYSGPVTFLYGKDSHTADIFTKPQTSCIEWQKDFPNHTLGEISGAHGNFFNSENIDHLAQVISAQVSHSVEAVKRGFIYSVITSFWK